MTTFVLKIDPALLENPDADLRYLLPQMLCETSNGVLQDDGYDYTARQEMLLFFLSSDGAKGAAVITDFIETVRVAGNNLRGAVVAAQENNGTHDVFYPRDFLGEFVS